MWSAFYAYYEIRKDENFSESIDTEKLRTIVSEYAIQHEGKLCYLNDEKNPWFSLTLIYTTDGGYAVGGDTYFEQINLISIITSKHNMDENKNDYYLNLLRSIADKLNWEIILEEDDDENENVVIEVI